MADFSGWDMAILGVAVYVAIMTLVRLMRRRHDEEVARLQIRVALEQRRKRTAEKQQRKQRAMEKVVKAQVNPKKAAR
jgi:hypothetical protein